MQTVTQVPDRMGHMLLEEYLARSEARGRLDFKAASQYRDRLHGNGNVLQDEEILRV